MKPARITLSDIDRYIELGDAKGIDINRQTIAQLIAYRRRFLEIKGHGWVITPPSASLKKTHKVPITVIVPVYNTSSYLDKCIDSILAQTFKDFEVICVDDASTDDSWAKLKAYSSIDERIRIVQHKENLGLGGARNTALKLASGKYVASVDSDDYIAPNMLEVLYSAARKEDACIVVCGFQRVRQDGSIVNAKRFKSKTLRNENNSLDIFSTCNPAFWNKLWRTELFTAHQIFFPNYVFYQDLATTPRILTRAAKVAFVEECPYYYLLREGSATYSHTPKHLVDYFTVFGLLRSFLRDNGLCSRYQSEFNAALVRACQFRAKNIQESTLSDEDKRRYLSHILAVYYYFLDVAPITDHMDITQSIDKINGRSLIDVSNLLPLTVMVKTICRPDILERFLISAARYQQARKQIFSEILVGDDSPEKDQKLNAEVIERVMNRFPQLRIRHLIFEYDIGCSEGRNRMVKAALSDNVLQCDDDFILDEACDLLEVLHFFNSKKVDIMGGWLKNRYDVVTGEYEFRAALGFFKKEGSVLSLDINENKYDIPDFSECQFIMNFFVGRREALLRSPWDSDLKTEEHHEFFYRAMLSNIKVSFCRLLFAKHTHEKANNSLEYNAHRFEKKRWRYYLFLSLKKCDAAIRIVQTKKWNRIVTWEVDRRKKTSNESSVPLCEVSSKKC